MLENKRVAFESVELPNPSNRWRSLGEPHEDTVLYDKRLRGWWRWKWKDANERDMKRDPYLLFHIEAREIQK